MMSPQNILKEHLMLIQLRIRSRHKRRPYQHVRYGGCVRYLSECLDEALHAGDGAQICGDGVEIEEISCLVGENLLKVDVAGLVD